MTNSEFEKVLKENPKLTTHGFGIVLDPESKLTKKEQFFIARQALDFTCDRWVGCCEWISHQDKLPGMMTADYWAEFAQDWVSTQMGESVYIPQGTFILAAIYMCYSVHRIHHSTGARIGTKHY